MFASRSYVHKLCLATGASGLILDCRIEDGNPADATLAVEMVERQQDIFARVPRQVAFDGGFASKANLAQIKELGVKDVMFSKKRGLKSRTWPRAWASTAGCAASALASRRGSLS